MEAPLFIYTKEEQWTVICFLWAKGVSGCEMHRRMSVQCRNSVVSKQSIYKWRFKNGWISIKHKEGAGPRAKWNSACVAYLLVQNLFFFSGYKVDCNNGPGALIRKKFVLKNEVLVRSLVIICKHSLWMVTDPPSFKEYYDLSTQSWMFLIYCVVTIESCVLIRVWKTLINTNKWWRLKSSRTG
jgi:hypothetical protein